MENKKISIVFFAILVTIFCVQSTDAQSVVLKLKLPNLTSSSPLLQRLYDAIQKEVDEDNDLIQKFLNSVTIPGLRNLFIYYINKIVERQNEAFRVIVEDATRIVEAINVAGVQLDEDLQNVVANALVDLLACKDGVEDALQSMLGKMRGLLDEFIDCDGVFCKIALVGRVPDVVDEIIFDNQTAYENCRDIIIREIAQTSKGLEAALAKFLNRLPKRK